MLVTHGESNVVSVEVVCRLNQARSVAIAAFLSRRFPQLTVSSSGIEAITGVPINRSVLSLLKKWGLKEIEPNSSSSRDYLSRVHNADLIIAADEFVQSELIKNSVSEEKIFCLNKGIKDTFFNVVDPVNKSFEELEFELTKSLLAASDLVKTLLDFPEERFSNSIRGIIPISEEFENSVWDIALEYLHQLQANILDLSSLSRRATNSLDVQINELESLETIPNFSHDYARLGGQIWRFRHESAILGRDLLSPLMLDLKSNLTKSYPLIVIGGPIRVKRKFKSENILALLESLPNSRQVVMAEKTESE